MSAAENETLIREWLKAFNERNYDRMDDILAQDIQWENVPTRQIFSGPEAVKGYVQGWVAAFSEGKTENHEVHAGEDFAVAEFAGRGTHDGTLQGPAGEIPPTNRSVDLPFCDVYHIRDGKIAEARTFYDTATIMSQLGAM
jgi:steroid delta-isomerase-like uncharacterized protein